MKMVKTLIKTVVLASLTGGAVFSTGCTITHKIAPSDKPILININLNIKQEIRVKLEKDIENMLNNNPDIF